MITDVVWQTVLLFSHFLLQRTWRLDRRHQLLVLLQELNHSSLHGLKMDCLLLPLTLNSKDQMLVQCWFSSQSKKKMQENTLVLSRILLGLHLIPRFFSSNVSFGSASRIESKFFGHANRTTILYGWTTSKHHRESRRRDPSQLQSQRESWTEDQVDETRRWEFGNWLKDE